MCDIAILVVDLMHGLEKQTLESLQLIRNKKTPFVVALNKIDRCYDWKMTPFNNVRDALDQQASHTQAEFYDRLKKIKLEFAEQGFNSELYWENEDPTQYISLCPTSAITGEGLPDLMIFISKMCQTMFKQKLREKEEFECTVLEVKVIEGLGTTIDVILVNGILKRRHNSHLWFQRSHCDFNQSSVDTLANERDESEGRVYSSPTDSRFNGYQDQCSQSRKCPCWFGTVQSEQ